MSFTNQKQGTGMPGAKRFNWIMGALLLGALVTIGVFISKNNQLETDGDKLSLTLEDLDQKKMQLEKEMVVMDSSYQTQITQNDSLAVALEVRVTEIDELEGKLWSMRKKLETSQEEKDQITARLSQLAELKIALEEDIVSLQNSNAELREENEQLASDLQISNDEIASLNEELQEVSLANSQLTKRLFEVAPAGFLAENFSVTAKKRNDKLTANARQAQTINVAFDLNDVPEEYQGAEEIYLVVTEFNGNPIKDLDTKEFTVKSAEPIDVLAADITQTTLAERQSVEMSFAADRDLQSGMYNVMVYADHGFLGATTFQLQ